MLDHQLHFTTTYFNAFNYLAVYICDHDVLVCQERVPFAVVGSNTVVDAGGKKVRGRVYPWGVVEGKTASLNTSTIASNC